MAGLSSELAGGDGVPLVEQAGDFALFGAVG